MLLHTPLYLLFLLTAAGLYWVIPAGQWRKFLLLGASLVFYAAFDWRFLLLLGTVILATYWIGAALPVFAQPRRLVWLGVAFNLGVLGIFKYGGFFLESARQAMNALNVPLGASAALNFFLPVGISFYTFQAISYTTGIYQKKIQPAGLVDFALYMAFFPKLIAGPIVQPKVFLEKTGAHATSLAPEKIQRALGLLISGLIKKLILADSLASLADVAFRAAGLNSPGFPSPLYLQGFYLYAIQIYADFSGYTDLARGSALLLGIDLPENFRQPYLASSLTIFWNRWHMSLTQWFREMLFFPLSRAWLRATRRRFPRLVQVSVTLVTFLLIGLWHGAGWTFIAWGAWHGILLSLEHVLNIQPTPRMSGWLGGLVTFHLVGLGWVLFRSESFTAAGRFLQGMLAFQQMEWMGVFLPPVLAALGLSFALDVLATGLVRLPGGKFRHVLVVSLLVLLIGLALLDLARGGDVRPFIYGQF